VLKPGSAHRCVIELQQDFPPAEIADCILLLHPYIVAGLRNGELSAQFNIRPGQSAS
jgi:hypothetical protein